MDMPDYINISPTSERRIREVIQKLSELEIVTGVPVYFRVADDLYVSERQA